MLYEQEKLLIVVEQKIGQGNDQLPVYSLLCIRKER